jgi:hypothetical protein
MHLLPTYQPKSKTKPTIITRRIYNEHNLDNLRACFELTDWESLIDNSDNIDIQVDVFTSYVNYCTDQNIPLAKIKKHSNNKPWITREIIKLVQEKHHAHKTGNRKLRNFLKRKISKQTFLSKRSYTDKINHKMANEPAKAWDNIKKLGGLVNPDTSNADSIKLDPNRLNQFYARFEKPITIQPTLEVSNDYTAPQLEPFRVVNVQKHLKQLDMRKGPGLTTSYQR